MKKSVEIQNVVNGYIVYGTGKVEEEGIFKSENTIHVTLDEAIEYARNYLK